MKKILMKKIDKKFLTKKIDKKIFTKKKIQHGYVRQQGHRENGATQEHEPWYTDARGDRD